MPGVPLHEEEEEEKDRKEKQQQTSTKKGKKRRGKLFREEKMPGERIYANPT